MKKEALIIIDMLKDFVQVDGKLRIVGATDIGYPLATLIYRKRKEGARIMYVCDCHETDSDEFITFPPHCIRGTWGAEIVMGIEPKKGDVVLFKDDLSMFTSFVKNPIDYVKGIDIVSVVGVATEYCVKESIMGTKDRYGKKITNLLEQVKEVNLYSNLIKPVDKDAGIKAQEEMNKLGVKFLLFTGE